MKMADELNIDSGQKVPYSPSHNRNVTPRSHRLHPSIDFSQSPVLFQIGIDSNKPARSNEYILVHLMFDAPLHNSEEFSQGCTAVIALPGSSSITFKSLHAAIAASLDLEEKDENGKLITHFGIAEWFAEHRLTMENIDPLPALTKLYVRWECGKEGDVKMPDMGLKTDLDVQKGISMMRQRGWKDKIVAVWHVAHRFEWAVERDEKEAAEDREEEENDEGWNEGF